ncbi:uncharacterized protein LOC110980557 [Acanthaster planci]|uniref:Uncharacterized protein LOC110980557 n=1 Tax=Acanthaster planci TaxID=133434 RepID=A0A8B7YKB0_ACAPL|nr:uncharacterized protein LOC110980557 [Acanthaster planci]
MSGIRIVPEGENLGVETRPRPKKRRSSILKSPSRNALQDLDSNADERDTTNVAKKKRRSSRRVSFANTYQVQEFLTTNQLHLLEETNVESTKPFSPEQDFEPPAHTKSSSSSSGKETTTTQSFQSDVSVGPGHCITGLETLLSGPIKNQSHQDVQESMMPYSYPQPREAAVQLPVIDETFELPLETQVGRSARGRSDPSNPETDEVPSWPGAASNHSSVAVGLVGPRYHCTLPMVDSFSSSCHSSDVSSASHLEVHNPDVDLFDAANFELKLCQEQFPAGYEDQESPANDEHVTGEAYVQKIDASSFLKSFMSSKTVEENFGQPVHSTSSTYADENQAAKQDNKDFPQQSFLDTVSSASHESGGPVKRKDAKSFLQSLLGNKSQPSEVLSDQTCFFTQDETASEMDLTACVSVETNGGTKKKDAGTFLKSFAESCPSDDFSPPGHSVVLSNVNKHPDEEQKTRFFDRDGETSSGMDLTTCVGSVLQVKDAFAVSVRHPDVTVRFGDDDKGSMELTQCIDGVQKQPEQPQASGQKRQSGRPLTDITQIFDGKIDGSEMDLTTCTNLQIPNSSNYRGPDGQTRIFYQNDTTAAMEMTTCLSVQEYPEKSQNHTYMYKEYFVGRQEMNTVGEKTRIFHQDDITGSMEMTACLDGKTDLPLLNKASTNLNSSVNLQGSVGAEKTQIFRSDDTTAAMEMTTCLDGNVNFSKSSGKSSIQKYNNQPCAEEDKTTVFCRDDTTVSMEMTTCIKGENSYSPNSWGGSQPQTAEQTRVFHRDDVTAAMEMTECLDERTSFTKLGTLTSHQEVNQQGSMLSFASECSKRKESTEPADGSSHKAKIKQVDEPNKKSVADELTGLDKTQMFKSEDMAGMEFTTCVDGLILESRSCPVGGKQIHTVDSIEKQPRSEQEISKGVSHPLSLDYPEDRTKTFPSDDAGRMEITTCIGGVLEDSSKTTDTQLVSTMHIDKTRIFTADETAQMELTTCVGSLKPLPSVVSTSSHRAQYIAAPDDTTKMEITTCVDGIFPKMSADSCQGETMKQLGDCTRIFSSDTASMDMTKCIGGLHLPAFAARPQPHGLDDQTRVFTSDNTARMEMTACIGGFLSKKSVEEATVPDSTDVDHPDHFHVMNTKLPPQMTDSVISSSSQQQHPLDQTRIFTSDNTASMEMTTCTGGIVEKDIPQSLGKINYPHATDQLPSHQTGFFDHEVTGKMELTTGIGGIKSRNAIQHSHEIPQVDSSQLSTGEEISQTQLTKCIDVLDGKTMGVTSLVQKSSQESTYEVAQSSEQTPGHGGSTRPEMKDARDSMEDNSLDGHVSMFQECLESSSSARRKELTKRSSDTFTIEPVSISIAATEPLTTCRRSDTYTLDKPSAACTLAENPTSDTTQSTDDVCNPAAATGDQVSPTEEDMPVIGDLNRWGSLDSSDGIENEQPVWLENTEDFVQLSAEAGVTRSMMVEAMKDQTDCESASAHELSSSADLGAQDVHVPPMLNTDIASRVQDILPASLLNLQTDVSLTKPTPGPVSMCKFLQFLTTSMSKGRRSVIPFLPQTASPKTLSDFMEDHFITKPKKDLYEWAVNHLSMSIEKMQGAVNEQEQRMSENNPDIVTEVECAPPEQAAHLQDHIESLYKACTKMSKASFQEWRQKMVNKTHQSLKKTEAEMNEILSSLSSSLDTLIKNMEELEKFKEGLDDTVTRLQRIEPPSQERVEEFINQRQQLAEKQEEVEEMKTSKVALQSESLRLKEEIKQYKEELADAREMEMLLSNKTTSNDALEEALMKLEDIHCLQQWRWRKDTEEELVFTFLEDSFIFTVKLGKEIEKGSGVQEKEITSLHMESLLADDAEVSAHLAHHLIQASIDVDFLHSRHPTTASLKMLLQDLSEVVSQADSIAEEIDHIRYRHVVTVNGTNATIEFSNLDAMVRFLVTFKFFPGGYPFSSMSANFKHKIGILKEQDVQTVINEVKPGWTYLSRLVKRINLLIQQCISSEESTF